VSVENRHRLESGRGTEVVDVVVETEKGQRFFLYLFGPHNLDPILVKGEEDAEKL
jgi:hypothetical protein